MCSVSHASNLGDIAPASQALACWLLDHHY